MEVIHSSGKKILIDEEDFLKIPPPYYLHTREYPYKIINGKWTPLSRIIMNPPCGLIVDHINGNRLDNRKSNLRVCTQALNMVNRGPSRINGIKRKYKGVFYKKQAKTNPYRAIIEVEGKRKHLGYFATEIEAAKAYNDCAHMWFGDFAKLNEIKGE